jgi:hypothetical protein
VYLIKLFILSLGLLGLLHPVHVSVTNFEYVSSEKSANISFKVYPHDFELAFIHNYNLRLNLGTDSIHPQWEKYIKIYLDKMFIVKVNNKNTVPLVFRNYEVQDESILLNFKAPINQKIKSIQIEDAFLLDVFENQTNLLILSVDGKEKGYNLNFQNYKVDFKL